MALSPLVDEALLTASSLKQCHELVCEAGCDFKPPWALGARFLVPFTEEQVQELLDQGVEVSNKIILALRQDVPAIKEALKSIRRQQRPHVQEEQRVHALTDGGMNSELTLEDAVSDDDDEALVEEVATSVATNSDLGYMGIHPGMSAPSSSWHLHPQPRSGE